jgi:hypothetical protein
MLEHRPLTRPEVAKVGSAGAKGDSAIWIGLVIEAVEILAVVLPEADGADEVIPALGERDIVAAGALVPRGRSSGSYHVGGWFVIGSSNSLEGLAQHSRHATSADGDAERHATTGHPGSSSASEDGHPVRMTRLARPSGPTGRESPAQG